MPDKGAGDGETASAPTSLRLLAAKRLCGRRKRIHSLAKSDIDQIPGWQFVRGGNQGRALIL
jgi:hypothetical protein